MRNATQPVFTYVLRDPDTNVPLYVGKGTWDRGFKHHFQPSAIGEHLREMRASGRKPSVFRILMDSSADAYELESLMIDVIGRRDDGTGPLFNCRPGGRATVHSDKSKEKMAAARRGTKLSEEHKKSVSQTLRGRPHTEERKQKTSAVMKAWWASRKSQQVEA